MQDRFKIRAVSMETKEIIYVNNYYWFEENGITEIDNNGTASGHTGEYWINQCTGLKDKNGKLIYEGDIVSQGTYGKWIVTWFKNMFILVPDDGYSYKDFENNNTYASSTDEILGNIYENKGLLKEE